jgi:hypothetical protein
MHAVQTEPISHQRPAAATQEFRDLLREFIDRLNALRERHRGVVPVAVRAAGLVDVLRAVRSKIPDADAASQGRPGASLREDLPAGRLG